ncbi:protein kinase [Aliiglaciecola sp. SL4]|uniref:protein kinase domain-containing protein n=1 Tax=Aliiglaciecola sp. SL4 TaxID=3239806 RepID=UPI00355B01AB
MTERSIQNANNLDTQPFSAAPKINKGELLANRFSIIKSLGNGAQADVYLAFDQLLEIEVAIKVVESAVQDPLTLNTVRNEVLIARKLQHPNIIQVFDVFEDCGLLFFTMEYIEGEALFKRLTQPISESLFEQWSLQLFQALFICQQANVKHGDIKPDNILIDAQNQLRLIDFGIGQSHDSQLQTSGHKEYSAPEVIHTGQSSTQSEIFSAGKVVAAMLSAVQPESADKKARKWTQIQQKFIEKLTHLHPQKRPTIDLAIAFYEGKNTKSAIANKSIKYSILSIIVICSLLLLSQLLPEKVSLPDKVIQLAVVNEDNSELLDKFTQLLILPLKAEPTLALSSNYHTQKVIGNLSLHPTSTPEDRVELATTLGLDAMILLSIATIENDDFLITARVSVYPEDISLFEVTQSVNADSLPEDFAFFSQRIHKQLSSYLSSASSFDNNQQDTAAGTYYLAAEKAFYDFDIENTRENLNRLFDLSGKDQYWRLKGRLLEAELNEDLMLAQQSIEKLVELFPDRADLLAKRADIYQWADQNGLAIQDYQSALQITPNDGQLWFELAKLKVITGHIRSAIKNELTRALITYRLTGDKAGEALVLNAYGVAHLRLSEYDVAQRYFEDSLLIRDAKNFPMERANTLANFANAAAINGQFQVAKGALEEASRLLEQTGNVTEQAHIFDTLGFLHEEQGIYYEALKYYKSGLDLRVSKSTSIEQAESMSNVAYMHFLTGEFSLADIYWQQASALFGKSKNFSHQMRTWQNLAQLSLAKGDNLAAKRYLQLVSEKSDAGSQQELMINSLLYSYYLFANGDLSGAIEKTILAKDIAKLTDDSRALTELFLWQGEICLKIADAKCLQEQLTQAKSIVSESMLEQQAVLIWLEFGLATFNSDLAPSEPKQLLDQLNQISIPIITEMKILLDIQERLKLPKNSQIMQKLEAMIKPIYYQQYMNLLYIQARFGENKNSLKQQLVSHPNYWRNHLYYSQIEGKQAQQKYQELTEKWLSQLTEEQAQAYQEYYLE